MSKAVCFQNDTFNPLTFAEDAEKEINAVFSEIVMNNRVVEMDEQEFLYYQSTVVDYVESVTIDQGRECGGR